MKIYQIYFKTKQKNSLELSIKIGGKSSDDVLEKFKNAVEGEYIIIRVKYLFTVEEY